jgi:hypothetical protein
VTADCSSRPLPSGNQAPGDPPAKVGFVVTGGCEQTSPPPRLSIGGRQARSRIGGVDRPGGQRMVPKVTDTVTSVMKPRPGGRC